MSDELKERISDHHARLGVLEERTLAQKSELAKMEIALALNNKLITDVDGRVISLSSFLKGASWLLGIGFTALALIVSYAALIG